MRFRVPCPVHVALHRYVYLFAPSLQWIPWPPLHGSPAVLHLHRYHGLIRLLVYPSLPPPVSLGDRFLALRVHSLPVEQPSCSRDPVRFGLGGTRAHLAREAESSPGFAGNPLESMPRARDSGDPALPLHSGGADAALRLVNSVGIATTTDVGAESSRPAFSLCTLRTRQSPGEWQHSLPACPLRL